VIVIYRAERCFPSYMTPRSWKAVFTTSPPRLQHPSAYFLRLDLPIIANLLFSTQHNLAALMLRGHSKVGQLGTRKRSSNLPRPQKKTDMELARAREAEKAARSYDSLFNVEPEDSEGGGASRDQRKSWRKISCHVCRECLRFRVCLV
jgi:hypothetical protein